jgi:hypothetical protein
MYYNFCRIHKTLRVTPAATASPMGGAGMCGGKNDTNQGGGVVFLRYSATIRCGRVLFSASLFLDSCSLAFIALDCCHQARALKAIKHPTNM